MKKSRIDTAPYDIRFKISLIAVMIFIMALFRFGPEFRRNQLDFRDFRASEQITIDLIEITTQSSPPASPPRPRVSVRTFSDPVIVETDIDIVFDFVINLDPGIARAPGTGVGLVVRNPQRPPRVQRIVEPIGPDVTTRIEIVAELTVGSDGRVEDVNIISIKRRNSVSGQLEEVEQIDKAYLDATREAAMQWQFRPATEQGNPVRSVSEHVFTFGRGIN
jgi:hypothetical protein